MENLSFITSIGKRILLLLTVLTISSTNVWATPLTIEDLNFGTPAVSENFENVTAVSTRGNGSSYTYVTDYTTYGVFTRGYIGRAASNGYDVKAAATPMTSKYIEIIASSRGAGMCFSRTFATQGAFSFNIAKTSQTFIGLYNNTGLMASGSMDAYTKAKCSVYLNFTGSAIQINSGSAWVDVVTDMTDLPDVFNVAVVYNNTNSGTTYNNNNTALAAKTAHVFINGSAIMNGSSPKAFTIPGATLGGFRIMYNDAGTAKVDDINIYDALPTAGATYTVTWVVNGSTERTDSNVSSGSAVTPPTVNPLPCGDKLAGWTDAAGGAYTHGTSNLETGATITITGDKTYYAVFADKVTPAP